jgi:hypothetical protein
MDSQMERQMDRLNTAGLQETGQIDERLMDTHPDRQSNRQAILLHINLTFF